MNRNEVVQLASGRSRGEDLSARMQKLTSRAFAQAYGREHGEINLRYEELTEPNSRWHTSLLMFQTICPS